MTDEIKKITIQKHPPSRRYPGGEIASSWYCVADQHVVLCDEGGRPTGGKRYLNPGGDPRLIASVLLRDHSRGSGPRDFNRPLRYPKGF